jgi:hypothetical protein
VAAAGSTTFTVAFNPSASGSRTATLHIASNDATNNPFNIALTGTGTVVALPVIAVEQPARTLVASGGARSYPTVALGRIASLTFTVRNTLAGANPRSNSYLRITRIFLSGQNSSEFLVSKKSISSIRPGKSTTFNVQFAPQSEGRKEALLTLISNDPDESPYLIQLLASTPNIDDPDDDSDHETASRVATAAPAVQSAKMSAVVPDVAIDSTPRQVTPGSAKEHVRKSPANPAVANPIDKPSDLALYKLWTFAFSGDPAKAAQADAMPEQVIVEDNGQDYGGLTFRRLKAVDMLLVYRIEESPDGTSWQALPIPWQFVGNAVDQGDGTERVMVRSNTPLTADNQGFMRVRVEILP